MYLSHVLSWRNDHITDPDGHGEQDVTVPLPHDLLEVVRALPIEMNVPKSFQSYGVLIAAFLINWMSSKILGGKPNGSLMSK